MPSQQLKEQQLAVAGFFELKSTQRLCGRPLSTVVLNVRDDARVWQKKASARSHRSLASDSINNALLRWFALL